MKENINLKYILFYIFKNKKRLLIGQSIILLSILVTIPIPLMLPVLVDEVLLDKPATIINNIDSFLGSGSAFYYISIVAVCVIFLRLLLLTCNIFITKIFTKISKEITYDIRLKLLSHLQKVNMQAYESLGSGSITSKLITDVNTLDKFIINIASKFVASTLTLIGISIVIISINPLLGVLIILIQPIIMLLSKKISKKTGVLKKYENESIADFQDDLIETLDLFGQIKASNKEEFFFNSSKNKANEIQIKSNEFNYKSIAYERFSFTLFLISFEAFRAGGLLLVAYSDLSIGMMFAMFGYIWFITKPIQDIITMQYTWASAQAAMNRINTIFDLNFEETGEKKLTFTKKGFNIKIEDLCFSYNNEKLILNNISLNIKEKEKVALIGASGSGKTTLAQLISGFYNKKSGFLYFNDIDISNIDRSSLRKEIFLVLQMPILFNNTLRFNITMGDNISDSRIFEALKISQLYNVVKEMPNELDTIVGKHGIRLSGGQRQRLSVARMIISNPSIVIFDESTSALDVQTENALFEALDKFLKEKTVITIAHRLSTVKNATKVFVIHEGKLAQEGTHKELEEEDGHYNSFVKQQLL